jgi:hypothetical protein
MQILTIEDSDFQHLLEAFQSSVIVGRYWRNGQVQFVRANNRFVMISPGEHPEKIAIRPARNKHEAMELAKVYLDREEARGNEVTRD